MSDKLPNSISKKFLWYYVNRKIKRVIHHAHVFSVISILFDEILDDLKNGKKIKIFNFGTFHLKKMKPRHYYDVNHQKIMFSQGKKNLKFTLAPTIKKKLCQYLDIDRTFKDD